MDPSPHDFFFHIRVFVGIVTGLAVTRLLTGLARFVQHPDRLKSYSVHIGWVVFILLTLIHFWWFEFGLSHVERWTFSLYFFIICYAALFFFISAVLFPERMEEYAGFADYFHSRQHWFFGLLSALFVIDVIDTALKGGEHFQSLGLEYPIRQAALFVFAIIAIFVRDRHFHVLFVVAALIAQVLWIVRRFEFPTW